MALSVHIRDLRFRYFAAANEVFNGLNLSIQEAECCAILGPTGAGKTTLLQILSGIIGSESRTVSATGSLAIGARTFEPIPTSVLFPETGYVMQDPTLQLSGIKETVHQEIAFTLENLGMLPADKEAEVDRILSALSLQPLADRRLSGLSGGELQRVALASILVARPRLLLLDEPANALDSRMQHDLKNLLRSMSRTSTVIFSDPNIEFSLGFADRFVILDKGEIVFSGSQPEFLRSLPDFTHLLPTHHWMELTTVPAVHPRLRPFVGQV